jgi:hypothetical protein
MPKFLSVSWTDVKAPWNLKERTFFSVLFDLGEETFKLCCEVALFANNY